MEEIIDTGVLKKAITLDDLPLMIYYKTEAREPITIAGQTYPQALHTIDVKSQEAVPEELRVLTIGTKVYFVPFENHDPINGADFKKIKLSEDPAAKTFQVHCHCFD